MRLIESQSNERMETNMTNRDQRKERTEDLIELGSVSRDTKGTLKNGSDMGAGRQFSALGIVED